MEKPASICPGESACGKFQIAQSEGENGLDACANCSMLPTKPIENENDDEDDVFDQIREIVFWENSFPGSTDWNCYPAGYKKMFAAWRDAELKIKEAQDAKLQQTLTGLSKMLPALFRFR